MKKYEVMYIIRPTVDAEGVKKVVEDIKNIFVNNASQVLTTKEIGLKPRYKCLLEFEIKSTKTL